jgi:hypothetical protein
MGQDRRPQIGKTTRPHAPDCPERQAIMNKFFMVFSQIMQILPLVMQAVEVFAPAKSGPVKKGPGKKRRFKPGDRRSRV